MPRPTPDEVVWTASKDGCGDRRGRQADKQTRQADVRLERRGQQRLSCGGTATDGRNGVREVAMVHNLGVTNKKVPEH